MPTFRQTNFSGGELSPKMWGRSDLQKYGSGLRTCRNFFISKQGAAISRPGTMFVHEAKAIVGFDESWTYKLIPFVYSEAQTFMLLFAGGPSSGYIWFIQNGKVLDNGADAPFEIPTPYSQADCRGLKFAQMGASLFITHPKYAPHELVLLPAGTFVLRELDFSLMDCPTEAQLQLPLPNSGETREWRWQVTVLMRDENGYSFETAPYLITQTYDPTTGNKVTLTNHNFALSNTTPAIIRLDMTPFPVAGYTPIGWNIYRGYGRDFGLVGSTHFSAPKGGGNLWYDYGDQPDWETSPPQGHVRFYEYEENDFEWKDDLVAKENPRTVTFFGQRLIFGGTDKRPDHIWASRINDFYNFDKKRLNQEDDSFEFTTSGRKLEFVNGMVGLSDLLIFTNSSVWSVDSSTGAFSRLDINARVQEEVGSAGLDPLYVEGSLLYARSKGYGVRDLRYNEPRRSWAGSDMTALADHIFEGRRIMDWCYAEDPWGVIWCILQDGTLASLTYSPEYSIWAWARHDTDGRVMAIASVPEGNEDSVYMVVNRTIAGVQRYFIERFATRRVNDVKDYVGVDSARRYYNEDIAFSVITGLGHLAGKEVMALVDGNVVGPLTVNGSGQVTLPQSGNTVIIGLPYQCDIELLDVAEAREKWKIIKKVTWELEGSRGIKTGKSFDTDLFPYDERTVAMGFGYIPVEKSLRAETIIAGAWTKHGRAVLRQDNPLPVTVLGATREGELS